MKIRISTDDLNPDGVVTDADTGALVPARSALITLEHGSVPRASLCVDVREMEIEADRVEWWGLGDVPTEALQAELVRRGERAEAQA